MSLYLFISSFNAFKRADVLWEDGSSMLWEDGTSIDWET